MPTTSVDSDGYCTKHQRQKEYDTLLSQGKTLCRFFFRGCNSEIPKGTKTCKTCIDKKKKPICVHVYENGKQCTYEILDNSKYCGKHQRDLYREYEKEKQVKICNIERGCMNVCEAEYQSCKSCIIHDYIVNDRYYSEHILSNNVCIVCEKEYMPNTLNVSLKKCDQCCSDFMNERKHKHIQHRHAHSDMTIEKYYETYVRGAYKRTKECEFHLTLDEFASLVTKPCFYCTIKDPVSFNGVDRVDNNGHYTVDNTVPCCTTCNRLKHSMSIGEFLNKCYAIQTFLQGGASITHQLLNMYPAYKTLSTRYYSDYKKSNDEDSSRKLEFTLTKDEFNSIRTNPCYICGLENSDVHYNGIDRVNNGKGYIPFNCKACCGHCNFMKANIPIGVVKFHVQKIAENPIHVKHKVSITPVASNQVDSSIPESDIESLSHSPDNSVLSESRFFTKELANLFQEDLEKVLQYCATHERSHIFARNVKRLYESKEDKTFDDIHVALIRFVNADKNRTYVDKKEVSDGVKHHKKANEVLGMLEQGKINEYLSWHNEHVGEESTLFRKHLEEFMGQLRRLTEQEKLDTCKKLLKQEQIRRGAKRAYEKTKEQKEIPAKPTKPTKPSKTFNIVDVTNIMPKKATIEHVLPELSTPKQWKTRDIYEFLNNNQEHVYKAYCESNNDTKLMPWEQLWTDFLTIKGQPFATAEPVIKSFVEDLRRRRHNALTAKPVLDREDRQVWPAETVTKLYKAGRIHEYKVITEEYAGDSPTDPKWQKRWEEFVGNLDSLHSDTDITKAISKFMTAQRAKKHRRSKT